MYPIIVWSVALNQTEAWQLLLQAINEQLEKKQVIVKQGAIVDAAITPTSRKPKGTKVYELSQQGEPPLQDSPKPGVDREGSGVKKGVYYG